MNIIEIEIGAVDAMIRMLEEEDKIKNAEEIQKLICRRERLFIMA